MNKEEIISYLKANPKDLYDVCEELKLRFPYENRDELMTVYEEFKSTRDYFAKLVKEEGYDKWGEAYNNICEYVNNMEKTYQLFNPSFDKEREEEWFIPNEYCKNAFEVFKYRKEMFGTQSISEDYTLDNIINEDMGYIWHEKGGQDGMYESFPFTFTREDLVKEETHYDEYLKCNCHYKDIYIRSYALGGNGGIAIVDKKTYCHYDDLTIIKPEMQDACCHSEQQIVTLGEDDGYHFLNSRRIYESCYNYNKDNKEFLKLLDMAKKEYVNYMKTRE